MMKVTTVLLVAICFGTAHATQPGNFHYASGGTDLDAVHAPAPAPGLVVDGRRTKGEGDKKDKKSKKKDKSKKDKKSDKKHKKSKKKDKHAEGRVNIRDTCESEEDAPVEVLVVEYDYTLQKDEDESLDSVVKEMEDTIHHGIVNELLDCELEGPVEHLRRRLISVSQSSRQVNEESLRVVGADPAPMDKPSKKDFCGPDADDDCVSMNGAVTLLLEGDVDKKQLKEEKEGISEATRGLIKSVMKNSPHGRMVDAPAMGSSRYDNPGTKESVESSTSLGGILAGVLAVCLAVAGGFFVYKKKKNDSRSVSRGGAATASEVPVAEAKVSKGDKDSSKVPVATVVETVDVDDGGSKSMWSNLKGTVAK